MCLSDRRVDCGGQEVVLMGEEELAACFDALTHGSDVRVACRPGYLRRLLAYVGEHYIVVKAAGGLVVDGEGRRLLMTRNGRADLPKGKVEAGETLAQAALRETEEETGLRQLTLGALRLKTYHIYNLYGGWHFKQTSWFDMAASGTQPLVPQSEEGITALEWVGDDEWRRRLEASYATMREIVAQID